MKKTKQSLFIKTLNLENKNELLFIWHRAF